MTTELEPGQAGITDEQVAASSPMVRALVVSRLELMWRACEPHILPEDDDLGPRKPDPRFVEAGIRITDRLIALYQLLKPAASEEEAETSTKDLVEAAVAAATELEARVRGPETG